MKVSTPIVPLFVDTFPVTGFASPLKVGGAFEEVRVLVAGKTSRGGSRSDLRVERVLGLARMPVYVPEIIYSTFCCYSAIFAFLGLYLDLGL